MARTVAISVRVEPDLKAAAERAAKDDRRTLASLVEIALIDYLSHKGYLQQTSAT